MMVSPGATDWAFAADVTVENIIINKYVFIFANTLQSARETNLGFESVGTHRTVLTQDKVFVVVVVVVRATSIVSTREGERPLTGQVHLNDGIDDQQGRITIVTLHI